LPLPFYLSSPAGNSGVVLGVLNIESSKPDHFSEVDVQFLTMLAAQAASALNFERLRNMEEVARTEREVLAKQSCFILMPFSDPFDRYFNAILMPAVESAGLCPVRADSLFGPANVMKDIWEGIRNSKCLIAELTTRNPNVMYELGLAHAMQKPVVLLTQDIDDVPFDLRMIRCIVYDTTDPDWSSRLREQITSHIGAVLREQKKGRRFRPFP
jgi:hypothetical protein